MTSRWIALIFAAMLAWTNLVATRAHAQLKEFGWATCQYLVGEAAEFVFKGLRNLPEDDLRPAYEFACAVARFYEESRNKVERVLSEKEKDSICKLAPFSKACEGRPLPPPPLSPTAEFQKALDTSGKDRKTRDGALRCRQLDLSPQSCAVEILKSTAK